MKLIPKLIAGGLLLGIVAVLMITAATYLRDALQLSFLPDAESIAFSSGGKSQDNTIYGIYTYEQFDYAEAFRGSPFSIVNSEDCPELLSYINDFEGWVDCSSADSHLRQNYAFDKSFISEGDYFYFKDRDGFNSYSLYFFDSESCLLYFFHNNI